MPNAGEPGPHVDVRGEAAVDDRHAWPGELGEGDHEERLGVLLGDCPGERRRAHRAGQRERRRDDRLAVDRHLDQAVRHRPVETERRVRVDDRHEARLAGELVAIDPAGEADHLDRVVDDRRPEPEALPRLVEQRDEREVHVEVAGRHRQVGRLEGPAALLVDDVERADDAEVVEEVGVIAGPPAALDVGDERRPADGAEHDVAVAEPDVPLRVAGVEPEGRRGERDELLDLAGIEADVATGPVDGGAAALEQVEGAVAEDLDADLGEDPERGSMERLDLVGREDLDRPVRVADRAPRELGDAAGRPAYSTAAGLGRHRATIRRGVGRPLRDVPPAGSTAPGAPPPPERARRRAASSREARTAPAGRDESRRPADEEPASRPRTSRGSKAGASARVVNAIESRRVAKCCGDGRVRITPVASEHVGETAPHVA